MSDNNLNKLKSILREFFSVNPPFFEGKDLCLLRNQSKGKGVKAVEARLGDKQVVLNSFIV